jgi:hypothetical protein
MEHGAWGYNFEIRISNFEIKKLQSSIVFVFMPVLGVRVVWMCVCGRFMFMPVAVGDGFPRCRIKVIVMSIVVTMPVFMCNPLVMVEVGVFFKKQQGQRDSDHQRCNDLTGRNGFSKKNCRKDDPKKGGTRENDLTASGAKFLGRSYVEHQAKTI